MPYLDQAEFYSEFGSFDVSITLPANYVVGATSSLPGTVSWIPVKPFINLLLNDHGSETTDKSPPFFEAGLKAGIWNFFELYVPILVSDNILSITGSFKERIRFVFRLDILNPLRSE